MIKRLQNLRNGKALVFTQAMLDHLGDPYAVEITLEDGRVILTVPPFMEMPEQEAVEIKPFVPKRKRKGAA